MSKSTDDLIERLEDENGVSLIASLRTSGRGRLGIGEPSFVIRKDGLFRSPQRVICYLGNKSLEEMKGHLSGEPSSQYKGLSKSFIKGTSSILDELLSMDVKSRQRLAAQINVNELNSQTNYPAYRELEVFHYLAESLLSELGFKYSFDKLSESHKEEVVRSHRISSFSEELSDLSKDESTAAALEMASVGLSLGRDYASWSFDNYFDIVVNHAELFQGECVEGYLLEGAVEAISKSVRAESVPDGVWSKYISKDIWLDGVSVPRAEFVKRVGSAVEATHKFKIDLCSELFRFDRDGNIGELTRSSLDLVGGINDVIPELEEHILIKALRVGNDKLFNVLLDYGVDPSIEDKDGQSYVSYHQNMLSKYLEIDKKIAGTGRKGVVSK